MENKIEVSIIIPVYNGSKTLDKCLSSIFKTKTKNFEVILIDDGSKDNTYEIARKYPCKIIKFDKNRGRSAARNEGIRKSSAEFVLFTDADCIVENNWQNNALETIKKALEKDSSIAAVEGKILPSKGFINKCDIYSGYGYNQSDTPKYHKHFCTANLIADKKKLIEAGLFNEKLITHEDQDLGFKLLKLGYKLFYSPNFSVIHNHTRTNFKDFLKHHYEWGKTLGNYLEKEYPELRNNPFGKIENILLNIIMSPIIAAMITIKIILYNLKTKPEIILYSPFIFLSKIAYRIGTIKYIMEQKAGSKT